MKPEERRPVANSSKQVYVVRIYRRREEPPGSLVGTVEEVATGTSTPFRTGEELLSLLSREKRR